MEQILPGVSIEVRPEGLITPGQVSISTIGIVGTANRGPVSTPLDPNPEIIGSPTEARQVFGSADAFDPASPGSELTLIRALDLAYDHGARDVVAVRVATGAAAANFLIASASGDCCTLTAATPGSWQISLTSSVDWQPGPTITLFSALSRSQNMTCRWKPSDRSYPAPAI